MNREAQGASWNQDTSDDREAESATVYLILWWKWRCRHSISWSAHSLIKNLSWVFQRLAAHGKAGAGPALSNSSLTGTCYLSKVWECEQEWDQCVALEAFMMYWGRQKKIHNGARCFGRGQVCALTQHGVGWEYLVLQIGETETGEAGKFRKPPHHLVVKRHTEHL